MDNYDEDSENQSDECNYLDTKNKLDYWTTNLISQPNI